MKILFATEELKSHPSEGLLVFSMHLCRFLKQYGELTVLYAHGDPQSDLRALKLLSRRTLLTNGLVRLLRNEKFDIIIYIPSSSLTPYGLGRSLLIRSLSKSPTILVVLQERKFGMLHRLVLRLGKPELVLSPVSGFRSRLDDLGVNTGFVMPGFDDTLFKPVNIAEKKRLREKYNIPPDRFIILHVGHIRESRNMQVFLRYREWGHDIQPVIKGGKIDPSWRNRLRMAGIIIIDEYIDKVHELYQAADCYIFPIFCPTGAIEFPLSVIEASACNLPVLTTRFGALPGTLPEGKGLVYLENTNAIPQKISFLRGQPIATSDKVKGFSWQMVFTKYVLPPIQSMCSKEKGAD